ncbi:hexose carrier protein [Aureobasidium pullulans]|uniref:Hexose carrier protein n=1 Tax=Aureobasidium pullulans TaxID=5580 RepID=A0A4S8XTW2_AURPU|nr:hexose carrier protein [Aureobasidium pullulans]
MPLRGHALTVGITATCGFSFMLFGWDQGVFGGILNNKTFEKQFNYPDALIQGQIVSTYDIGCILGAIMSLYFGDYLGRRRSVAMSSMWVILGGAIQASAFSLPQMIIGRVIAGLGIGQSTAVVPMWQAETSKPEHRGKLVALQLVMVIFGISLTNWINLAMTYVVSSEVTWRFPLAMQCFWAVVTICLLPFMVESPRWLCYKDRHAEARTVLARLANLDEHDQQVAGELKIISQTIAAEKAGGKVGWSEVFSGGEQQNFRRIVLGAGTSIFQQMGGINVVVYYFPVILTESFGFSPRLALILSGVDFVSLMFWGSCASLLIDRFGRKPLMLFGAVGCGICFTLVTVGLAIGTKPTLAMSVSFIFGYHLFYGVSFLCIPFLYPSEINSSRMRSIGNSIAMVTNWLFVYVVVLITPSAIANIAWRFYIIFAVLNFAWFPIVYFFYIETKGLSLEEVDLMFKIKHRSTTKISYGEAALLAKEEANMMRQGVTSETIETKFRTKDSVERQEYAEDL